MLTLRKFRRIRSIDVKNRLLSRHRGKGRDEMDEYFRAFYQSLKGNYAPHIVRMLKAYVAKGYDVVVITGALYDYARFIAEDLGVQTVVATRLTYRDHRFTGSIEEPEMLGDAKKEYILRSPYAGRKKIFYTDSLSDIPLLLISEKGYIVTLNSRDHAVRYFRGYDKN
jgi:HAD superfamily phosphoserine phosphatase-like hydrolase